MCPVNTPEVLRKALDAFSYRGTYLHILLVHYYANPIAYCKVYAVLALFNVCGSSGIALDYSKSSYEVIGNVLFSFFLPSQIFSITRRRIGARSPACVTQRGFTESTAHRLTSIKGG